MKPGEPTAQPPGDGSQEGVAAILQAAERGGGSVSSLGSVLYGRYSARTRSLAANAPLPPELSSLQTLAQELAGRVDAITAGAVKGGEDPGFTPRELDVAERQISKGLAKLGPHEDFLRQASDATQSDCQALALLLKHMEGARDVLVGRQVGGALSPNADLGLRLLGQRLQALGVLASDLNLQQAQINNAIANDHTLRTLAESTVHGLIAQLRAWFTLNTPQPQASLGEDGFLPSALATARNMAQSQTEAPGQGDFMAQIMPELDRKLSQAMARRALGDDLCLRVGVALETSLPMRALYQNGVMTALAQRLHAVAVRFDNDGALECCAFSSKGSGKSGQSHLLPAMTPSNADGFVRRNIHKNWLKLLGREAAFAPLIQQFLERWFGVPVEGHGLRYQAGELWRKLTGRWRKPLSTLEKRIPALLVVVTQGHNEDITETLEALNKAARQNMFIMFLVVGQGGLRPELAELLHVLPAVDSFRLSNLAALDEERLYQNLLSPKLAAWLKTR
ncbi:VWA domain-containing protein [Formicincola oecophyllae]|uniref:VWA domain-containing protein n=1 Tax=Formicincola oecophyllae TaxID=2558361 RepID=A0A4Y6UC82_9PROT|nr:VWA domain-containing protein [Formicincola oecophyllae]QDH14086.1 VWA domain-containing protein [Formicincola oecophyllae]